MKFKNPYMQCEECDKYIRKDHIKRHNEICKTAKYKPISKVQQREKRDEINRKQELCRECDQVFKDKEKAKDHRCVRPLLPEDSQKFQCSDCHSQISYTHWKLNCDHLLCKECFNGGKRKHSYCRACGSENDSYQIYKFASWKAGERRNQRIAVYQYQPL